MTKKDINDIISIICPNDEDFEKTCISPAYLKKELEVLALEQEPCEDCISRQAVINGIDNYIEKVQSTGAKDDFISFEELVVKALPPVTSQEPIIDKIRAEILELRSRQNVGVLECLDIIDKYKKKVGV